MSDLLLLLSWFFLLFILQLKGSHEIYLQLKYENLLLWQHRCESAVCTYKKKKHIETETAQDAAGHYEMSSAGLYKVKKWKISKQTNK